MWAYSERVEPMRRNRKAVSAPPRKSPRDCKSQSLDDPQFDDRLRIAKQLVKVLREAGYSCGCEQVDDGPAPPLKYED